MARSMVHVARGDTLRHEHLDRLSHELGARVAERSFGLRVGVDDAPFGIHADDRIRRRLDEGERYRFTSGQAVW